MEVWESVRNLAPEALRQAPTVTLMGRQQVDWFDNNVLTEAKRGLKGLWRTATAWTCTGIIASKRSAENIYGDASQTHPHTLITITHTHTRTRRDTHTRARTHLFTCEATPSSMGTWEVAGDTEWRRAQAILSGGGRSEQHSKGEVIVSGMVDGEL